MFRSLIIIIAAIVPVTAAGADALSDPMRPYSPRVEVERSVGGKAFSLSAILYSADRRIAIVNGQPVAEGQRVNGARVHSIKRGAIELVVDGEILKLTLLSGKQTK